VEITDIAVDGTNAYWAEGAVMKVSLSGGTPDAGTPSPLASGNQAQRIATDGTNVYWTSKDGDVSKVPVGGGAVVVLASGQDQPWDIAIDAHCVYWTNRGGTVMTIRK
jgi:hypothetical protein